MAMQNLKEQVNNLTNIDFSDDSALADWFTDGHRFITKQISREGQHIITKIATLNGNNIVFPVPSLASSDIISVLRGNGTDFIPCRSFSAGQKYKFDESSGYFQACSNADPGYYIEDGFLYVVPTPDSNTARITYKDYKSFVASGSGSYDITSITDVPDLPINMRHGVILYAAIRVCDRKLVEINSNLPSDLTVPVIEVPSISLPSEPDFNYLSQVIETGSDFTEMETALDDEDTEMSAARSQKIQSRISEYGGKVSNATNKYKETVDEFTQKLARYSQEVQKASQSNSSNLQKFSQDLANFNAKLQKETALYNWVSKQRDNLKLNFKEFMSSVGLQAGQSATPAAAPQ